MDVVFSRWEDGKPKSIEYSQYGDTTVLKSSGSFSGDLSYTIPATHRELMNTPEGITTISQVLGVSTQPAPGPVQHLNPPLVVFIIHSPVKIHVVGPNTDIWSEEIVVISEAIAGTYTVTAEGTGTGQYTLQVGLLSDNGQPAQGTEYENTTTPGKKDTYVFPLDPNSNAAIQIQDPTGALYLRSAKQKLLTLKSTFSNNNLNQAINDINQTLGLLAFPPTQGAVPPKIQQIIKKIYNARSAKNEPLNTFSLTDSALDDLAQAYAIVSNNQKKKPPVNQAGLNNAKTLLGAIEMKFSAKKPPTINQAQSFDRATELYNQAVQAYQSGNLNLTDILLLEFSLTIAEII